MNSQQPSPSVLCRSGCGFYGCPASDGYCSKCFKDVLKRKNDVPTPSVSTIRNSPPASPTAVLSGEFCGSFALRLTVCDDRNLLATHSSPIPMTHQTERMWVERNHNGNERGISQLLMTAEGCFHGSSAVQHNDVTPLSCDRYVVLLKRIARGGEGRCCYVCWAGDA